MLAFISLKMRCNFGSLLSYYINMSKLPHEFIKLLLNDVVLLQSVGSGYRGAGSSKVFVPRVLGGN